ncbi:MAG TPA: alkaline phosphatase family protein [Actinomycetota bacterium]|nr:alkaline phosphatase family protein [Actinomycetota bacterium]
MLAALLSVACTATKTEQARVEARRAEPGRPTAGPAPGCDQLDKLVTRITRGWVPGRSPDLAPIPRRPTYIGGPVNPVHTAPWDYLTDVPLVIFGPGLVPARGESDAPATMADVAPTIGSLIGFDFDTSDGDPLPTGAEGRAPRLVVTVVWDGGGWNVLREHPTEWPFLERAMRRGVSFTDFELGSTPTNTPPIHTTLGTGRFPRAHGIPGVKMRTPADGYIDPFEGHNASEVRVPMLADLYDVARDNRPEIGTVATVNWHLGMMGHGDDFEDGDADLSVLLNDRGLLFGDSSTYAFPPAPPTTWLTDETDRLDRSDGAADGRWNDDDLTDLAVRYSTPAYVAFQERVLEQVIETQRFGADAVPDLLFTNFKQIDDAGHKWGPFSAQVGASVRASDDALRSLVRVLNAEVGRGRWVVLVTADHGQMPYPEDSGEWPVSPGQLTGDIDRALDDNDNGIDLVWRTTAGGIFIQRDEAKRLGLTMEEIAEWLIDYRAEDNAPPGEPLPRPWRDDPQQRVFSGVVAGDRLAAAFCPGVDE